MQIRLIAYKNHFIVIPFRFNGCCGKTLFYEGIYIFTDMRQFVKILMGYM
jgi:hypothetical protein